MADNDPDTAAENSPLLVVADDRPVLRAGLARLLEPLHVTAEVPLQGLADALLDTGGDVVVVGVRDDDRGAFQAIAAATSRRPGLSVVVVADSATVIELREAVIAGVDSFLLTSTTPEELRDAVERTLAGERVVAPSIAMQLASTWRADDAGTRAALTQPELEVLKRAAEGLTNDRIAQELSLASRTVKTHIQNVLAKLDVPDRTAAVARAIRLGLIS